MAYQFNIYEAKTRLSHLVALSLQGEEVVISKAGKPVVTLQPCQTGAANRVPGALSGKIKLAEDFDILPDDLMQGFYGAESE